MLGIKAWLVVGPTAGRLRRQLSAEEDHIAKCMKKTTLCKQYLQGQCHLGDQCAYAHQADELTPKPPVAHLKESLLSQSSVNKRISKSSKKTCKRYTMEAMQGQCYFEDYDDQASRLAAQLYFENHKNAATEKPPHMRSKWLKKKLRDQCLSDHFANHLACVQRRAEGATCQTNTNKESSNYGSENSQEAVVATTNRAKAAKHSFCKQFLLLGGHCRDGSQCRFAHQADELLQKHCPKELTKPSAQSKSYNVLSWDLPLIVDGEEADSSLINAH